MAEAKDWAMKGLDILGGLGGAIAGVAGGGEAGAKGVQAGAGGIKDLVNMATGGDMKRPQPQAEPSAAPAPIAEPKPQRTRARRFDAPRYRQAEPQEGDEVIFIETGKPPTGPLQGDARKGSYQRLPDGRLALVDLGPADEGQPVDEQEPEEPRRGGITQHIVRIRKPNTTG